MSKRRRYKPEEKLAAVLEYVNGNKSYTEAGKVVGVLLRYVTLLKEKVVVPQRLFCLNSLSEYKYLTHSKSG